MTYEVHLSEAAKNFLRNIRKVDAKRIGKKIDSLGENPRPHGVDKLSGAENIYRIRSENYRVIYQIEEKILHILVLKIGHRKEVYRDY